MDPREERILKSIAERLEEGSNYMNKLFQDREIDRVDIAAGHTWFFHFKDRGIVCLQVLPSGSLHAKLISAPLVVESIEDHWEDPVKESER